ncbi:hypothetical protein PG984_007557 [Apiospora sp. TS-2023a]
MASFGKLSTSLIQGVNENTLALANLNFDFSLVKVQAPVEFQQIGPALAAQRRQNAESGTSHQTARKLGALFESLVPSVPRVIAAYGKRSSEIIQKPGANPSGTTKQHGPFATFVGADATGIWAAATSGQASIAIHLLACMLARTFSDPAKAVSAWVELVDARKQEIMAHNTHSNLGMADIAALNASGQQVTREEIRLWDASARAWLQTADSAMRKEHVQLKLVIKEPSIPVMTANSLYESVIKAWTQALVGIERLIAGEPQSVTNGAILLAISAWHLFPDLLVFSSQTTSVPFDDPLMSPSGLLTVGITNAASSSAGKEGIYWSVALSHYRHYGRPIRAVSEIDDRLTMDELCLVTFGGVLKLWGEPRANFEPAAAWFVALWNSVHRARAILSGPSWIKPLVEASARLLAAGQQERKELLSLVDFGFRRGSTFLIPAKRKSASLPWFGLRCPHVLHALQQSSTKECGIEYLRQTAAACELKPHKTLITMIGTNPVKKFVHHNYFTALPIRGSKHYNWKGKFPLKPDNADEDNPHGVTMMRNVRDDSSSYAGAMEMIEIQDYPGRGTLSDGRDKMDHLAESATRSEGWSYSFPASIEAVREAARGGLIHKPLLHRNYRVAIDETITECQATLPSLPRFSDEDVKFTSVVSEETKSFCLWLSQEDSNNHQTAQRMQNLRQGKGQPLLDLDASTKILKYGINRYLLWQYFAGADPYDPDDDFKPVLGLMRWERGYWRQMAKSLKNLATACNAYKTLDGATVASTIVARGIHDAKWALSDLEVSLTRSKIFSCIAMMETGTMNLDAEKLDDVLALASGNSIYILRHFVTDPAVEVSQAAVVRIPGNVGRAGISLLVPPASRPLVRPLSNSLRAVTYADFDGRKEDNFKSTSLHLSFTPHEFPLDYGVTGIIDHQIFFVESVISVHDSGKWVADLDILGLFQDGPRHILPLPKGNRSRRPHVHTEERRKAAINSFVSVDTWEEVLDTPPTHSLVRASNNWAARLAVLAVIRQNLGRAPKFTADDDEDNVTDNEPSKDEEKEQQDELSETITSPEQSQARFATLENGDDVCWACMHNRLTKMGWLASQDPCFVVI